MIDLKGQLNRYFGFKNFRPGQQQVMTALLKHRDVLAVLPTGGGKTLLYQLYAAITHQRVIIVSPLISLMQDQVGRLQYLGSKHVVALTSGLDFKERQFVLKHLEQYQFIYVSPEMLANPQVITRLQKLAIGLLVIDEAHCISEWGPDFRPDYLKLAGVRKALKKPLTLMMTATATVKTRLDILRRLEMRPNQVKQVELPVNRKNIFLSAKILSNQSDKNDCLISLVNGLNGAGIIYFSSRNTAESVAAMLAQKTTKRTAAYHGGMENRARFQIQQQFMQGEIDVVCATSAFGMGIDKNNVRYVIHYHLPGNVQSYMQEIGRAGRDGKPALAILLYEPNDRYLQANLIENTYPEDQLIAYLYNHPEKMAHNDQFRVVEFYHEAGFLVDKASSLLHQAKQRRIDELGEMTRYIFTSGCRRQFLLRCFDESLDAGSVNYQFCCDFHSDFWPRWQAFNARYLKSAASKPKKAETGWRETLQKLFLSKN